MNTSDGLKTRWRSVGRHTLAYYVNVTGLISNELAEKQTSSAAAALNCDSHFHGGRCRAILYHISSARLKIEAGGIILSDLIFLV